jgi:hypothetical protein
MQRVRISDPSTPICTRGERRYSGNLFQVYILTCVYMHRATCGINVDNAHKLVDRKSIETTNEGVDNTKKSGSYLNTGKRNTGTRPS